jgi:hypothetical protein
MRDGIDVRGVVRIGIGAIVVFAAVVALVMALTSRWDKKGRPAPAASPRSWISGPVLETHPQADLARYLAAKQKLIDSYGWVDRQNGVARMPLDEAMHAVAQGARP